MNQGTSAEDTIVVFGIRVPRDTAPRPTVVMGSVAGLGESVRRQGSGPG